MTEAATSSNYLVIYEKTATGYSAYVPDLPGCISTGAYLARNQTEYAGSYPRASGRLREFGDPIPHPTTVAEPMQVPA